MVTRARKFEETHMYETQAVGDTVCLCSRMVESSVLSSVAGGGEMARNTHKEISMKAIYRPPPQPCFHQKV